MSMRTALMEMAQNQLNEAVKYTHVLVDKDNKVVAAASDEKGIKQSLSTAHMPPMSIKDKSTLKIVKLKKPANQKRLDSMRMRGLDEAKSVDYGSRMTDAQKKKFHDLKKKMTGGPEYQKIMRKNQSPVKSDDEFHNLVLKKVMSEERAAWVPESILDDDVSHFMGAAAAAKKAGKSHFDFGGKKYKVTMKHDAAKKIAEATFATDIDYNEEDDIKKVAKRFGVKVGFVNIGGATEMQMTGDKNKIMKAVKALGFTDQEIKNAYFKESAECPTCGDGECQCEQPVEEAKVDEVSYKTAMKSYQKAMGQSKDADDAGDKETGDKKFDQAVKFGRYANKKFQSSRNKKKLVRTLSRQVPLGTLAKEETVEENYTDKQDASYRDEPTPKGAQKRLKALHKKALAYRKKHGVFPSVRKKQKDLAMKKNKSDLKFESVEENLAPGATAQHSATKETSDTWDKQMSNGENDIPMGKKKDFVDQHTMEVAYDAEAIYKQNKYEALSKTPARPGDKSDGDKNVVNPIPTNMVDGMRAALAKMKNSGE